jgi:hypothetical protein
MTSADYLQLEQISRRSLRMYDLTDREKQLAEVIIDFSFKRGRESAVIPSLQHFVMLTGLDKGDISRALQRLEDRGIVQIKEVSEPRYARDYAFIPSARFWMEKTPLYDVEAAIECERELARINATPAGFEPMTGQGNWLPADEPGLNDGLASAARDDALSVGESPIGKLPTTGSVGDSPTVPNEPSLYSRAGDVQNVTVQNVKHNVAVGESPKRRFADADRQFVFEQLEELVSRHGRLSAADFQKYFAKWLVRVKEHPLIIREAIGDTKLWLTNPHNKLDKSVLAMVFRRAQKIAQVAGKRLHLC